MIISHKYKFIFIKTKKTAGTSIESYLSKFCDKNDIVTPIGLETETRDHIPRNYTGFFNPFPEIIFYLKEIKGFRNKLKNIRITITDFIYKKKFYNHIPAFRAKLRVKNEIWNNYFKFCVERNPWDITISHYEMRKHKNIVNNFDEYMAIGDYCLNGWRYLHPKTGKLMVDKVLKYENLSNELSEIFSNLKIPFDGNLGIRAKSNIRKDRRPYQEFFSFENKKYKEIIESNFQKEIKLHNYKFQQD